MSGAEAAVERVFREEYGRVLATLIRVLGDIDAAEEAMQDAAALALQRWPADGIPDNPAAWVTTAARRKAIDRGRRERQRGRRESAAAATAADPGVDETDMLDRRLDSSLEDDRLRLIFTCCHPALHREAQVALTLNTLVGLSAQEIARAFLVSAPAMSQRLVRAKQKIKAARIPYRVPPDHLLPERIPAVLAVVYLIFNEGYSASVGEELIRRDLTNEAIRLGRLLVALMPDEPEALGLVALMLLHDSRREARTSACGDPILLEQQDRALWNATLAQEGRDLLERALQRRRPASYQIQAAIAAVHSEALDPGETDWPQIVALYEELLRIDPSPVVALNRAAAVSMVDGPERGLRLIDATNADGALSGYLFFHAARADCLRRLDRVPEAVAAYEDALALSTNAADRRFLASRVRSCGGTVD